MIGIVTFIGLLFLSGMIGIAAISFRKNIEENINSKQDDRF